MLGPQSNPMQWHTEGRDRVVCILLIRMPQGHRWMTFESSVSDLCSYVIWVGGV